MKDNGTHCAGIIGAEGNNNLGIVGVNWKVSLVALKFFDENGRGFLNFPAIGFINYATKMNIDVLSNSWGGGPKSQVLYFAIKRYSNSGGIFIFQQETVFLIMIIIILILVIMKLII